MELTTLKKDDKLTSELYFLVTKFLAASPLTGTLKTLLNELQKHKVLPTRLDWEGTEHSQNFEDLERRYPHISPDHLLELCGRLGPILDREIPPSVSGIRSLLGAGRQSLLRTLDSVDRPWKIQDYCTRRNNMPLLGNPKRRMSYNMLQVLTGREASGPLPRRLVCQPSMYSKFQLVRKTLGHLSAVYCVMFDHTGRYIITGADDNLIKLWSATDGRLLATFRGSTAEITDLDINYDNTLIAGGCLDKSVRVWDLQTTSPIGVLIAHTAMITSVLFCPSPRGDLKYLVTTSNDGSIAFWTYIYSKGNRPIFITKPIQYFERIRPGHSQMICSSFSPGGMFLAAGSADHHVRVYLMHGDEGPKRILETGPHLDAVDSIQWANSGLRFISGSKDGSAHIWHFESQHWKSAKLQDTSTGTNLIEEETKKLKVTMVAWNCNDSWVITAATDQTIKIWNPDTMNLTKTLRGHTCEVYVLEAHPSDPNILMSGGHDGQIFIWDIMAGEPVFQILNKYSMFWSMQDSTVRQYMNNIEGGDHGSIFDAKWSKDGMMIAATDSHGHLLMLSLGTAHPLMKKLPNELFFHTDYRPLIRDANSYVLDEQTQTAPHLMPPPFLVDVDGNPHPPHLQRLVPGRESCTIDLLVPNIAFGIGGMQEVIEGLPLHEPRSNIDRMIEALAAQRRRNEEMIEREQNEQAEEQLRNNQPERQIQVDNDEQHPNFPNEDADAVALRLMNSPRGRTLRRNGDIEGVRNSIGNWQRDGTFKYIRRTFVKPISSYAFTNAKLNLLALGAYELELYRREMRRRPVMINTSVQSGMKCSTGRAIRRATRRPPRTPAYRTRAVREMEVEVEDEMETSSAEDSPESSAGEDLELSASSSSDTESSAYSDWVTNQAGVNLEPPKRSKRKPVKKRSYSPEGDENKRRIPGKKKMPKDANDIPENYRPPEWLSEVIPRKAPYYPQMGDEVVYWRQGHERYFEAVKAKNVYNLGNKYRPWDKIDLRDHETVKVIGMKYEIKPPRLCCLKLAIMAPSGELTRQNFTVKYHDMPDVLDFLVLKQTYDTAVSRNWSPGDRFRCMIDDSWWMGVINSIEPISSDFPSSLFMTLRVQWDNGEYESMSPWDLEPVNEDRLPTEVGGAVAVLPEEIQATLYQPGLEEWPHGDREASCRRIISGLEEVMGLAIAELFVAPVDLNIYPSYAFIVEYPIDLSTIKTRFENHFYRRITSAQFDVRYLATNAEKFNKSHSIIVKQARIVTDLCLRIIREEDRIDVGAVYHQLLATYQSSDSETEDADHEPTPGPSAGPAILRRGGRRSSKQLSQPNDWKSDCRELLGMIWQHEDSVPFREPVDPIDHPDYNQIIDTPMDLRSVMEDLFGGNYECPEFFARDMRKIFVNSKNYNTNRKSRIYSMTVRLSSLFEDNMKSIMYQYKSSMRRSKRTKSLPKDSPSKMNTRASTSTAAVQGNASRFANTSYGSSSLSSDPDDDRPLVPPSSVPNGVNGDSRINAQPSTEHDSSSASSIDSNVPLAVRRKLKYKIKNDSDSEESYKPLRVATRSLRRVTKSGKKQPPESDTDESDEEDDEKRVNTRNRGKRTSSDVSQCNDNKPEVKQDILVYETSESEQSIKPKRRVKYESDHSYHLDEGKSRKRKHFDSESEDACASQLESASRCTRGNIRKQATKLASMDEDSQPGPSGLQNIRTRRGKRPQYKEDSEDDATGRPAMKRPQMLISDEEPSPTSVSSRGRVRKLTHKARGLGILL